MSKSHHLPKHVIVRVDPPPTEHLAVSLFFGMRIKNNFNYLLFVDSEGTAEVLMEELLKIFDEERNAFIMDYGDLRTGFTGEINVKVLSTLELQSALNAFEMFKEHLCYPLGYESRLKEALERGQNPQDYRAEVVTRN